ncbi:unnamed protein product [Heterobilharzia americana]|nr:unnamed protein product [Heterobilharzia americana]CAH8598149.1 unnamed protein product [Heterobilharzia americana]
MNYSLLFQIALLCVCAYGISLEEVRKNRKLLGKKIENNRNSLNEKLSIGGETINDFVKCKTKFLEGKKAIAFVKGMGIKDLAKMKSCFGGSIQHFEKLVADHSRENCDAVKPKNYKQEISRIFKLISNRSSKMSELSDYLLRLRILDDIHNGILTNQK